MKTTESYVRYSDHNQDDGYSVEYQCTEINEYCVRNGLVLHMAHIDQAQTATKVAGRESFFALIDRVKAGTVGTIIVYKMNRMFRNSFESHKYRKMFRQHGVKLISVTEMIDENTSSGRLMTNVLADIDQYQSETTSDHVKSSMREMARQGFYTGGVVAFGFGIESEMNGTKVRKKLVICEAEADIVRSIFEQYADGNTLSSIQDTLRESGIRKRKGGIFTQQDIARLLRNDAYIGTHRFKTQGYDDLVIPNLFDAIVDADVWQKVQARKSVDKKKNPNPRKQNQRIYALTGFIRCADCGDYYTGYTSGACKRRKSDIARHYYACRKKQMYRECKSSNIRKEYIEKAVLDAIKMNILNEKDMSDLAAKVAEMCQGNPAEITAKLKKLKTEKTRIEKRIDELIDMKLDGKISAERLERKSNEAEADLLALNGKILGLQEQKNHMVTEESVRSYLQHILAGVDESNGEILKEIFETFVEKVLVDDSTVQVFLKVYPYAQSAYNDSNRPPCVELYAEVNRQ